MRGLRFEVQRGSDGIIVGGGAGEERGYWDVDSWRRSGCH